MLLLSQTPKPLGVAIVIFEMPWGMNGSIDSSDGSGFLWVNLHKLPLRDKCTCWGFGGGFRMVVSRVTGL